MSEPTPAHVQPLPFVSLYMAVRNEAHSLRACLDGFLAQSYPRDRFEVVLALAGTDGTREIAQEYAARFPGWLKLLENPSGRTVQGLNLALHASKGEILALYIGHAIPEKQYLERMVEALAAPGVDYVGGRAHPVAAEAKPTAQAIARALQHPFAVGRNAYSSHKRRAVKASHWMAVHRSWVEKIGPFDESLQPRGEDCDWYARLAEAGAKGWYDPTIRSDYHVRRTFRDFALISFRNAFYRIRTTARTGRCLENRHLIPAWIALVGMVGMLFPGGRHLQVKLIGWYSLALIVCTVQAAWATPRLFPRIGVAFLILHVAHLAGLVSGLILFGPRLLRRGLGGVQ